MIMDLPKKFRIENYARVEEGVLYIERLERIEDLMYELTYAIRKHRCVYCRKKLKRKNSTLDHRYPRDTGGVSIVNNLYPTCPLCNSHKSNFLHHEYLKVCKLPRDEKKKEIKKFYRQRDRNLKNIGYMLPKKWIENVDISEIKCRPPGLDLRGKKYHRIIAFWDTYHKLPRPIVLDRNNVLLDGYNIIIFSRDFKIKTIPAIKLENVELLQNEFKGEL
ncbi:MAG: HNH endonuclease [Clostridia bacterium]|nr:HNH endonuclease [Clostridia bacterium]